MNMNSLLLSCLSRASAGGGMPAVNAEEDADSDDDENLPDLE